MAPHSMGLRSRVLADRVSGVASQDVAANSGSAARGRTVSTSGIRRARTRPVEAGELPQAAVGEPRRGCARSSAQPDRTLVEIRAALGVPVALSISVHPIVPSALDTDLCSRPSRPEPRSRTVQLPREAPKRCR